MSKCILIVDDEEDIRSITKMALEMGTDWTVLTASSGSEALEVAATSHPDTILLDMMMPDMDGRATLKRLKAHASTQPIPVIMVTARPEATRADCRTRSADCVRITYAGAREG